MENVSFTPFNLDSYVTCLSTPSFRNFKVSPLQRGAFPLDHDGTELRNSSLNFCLFTYRLGECREFTRAYLNFLKSHSQESTNCRLLNKEYIPPVWKTTNLHPPPSCLQSANGRLPVRGFIERAKWERLGLPNEPAAISALLRSPTPRSSSNETFILRSTQL